MKRDMPIFILITSGNGPVECNLAVAGVVQHMLEDADTLGLNVDVSTTPSKHGLKSAVVLVHGDRRYEFPKRWCGTIRWRSKSALRPNHK